MTMAAAAVLVVTTTGCRHHRLYTGGHVDTGAVADQIKGGEKRWNDWFHDKAGRNAEAISQFYTDDAFFMAPGVKGTDGVGEIKKAYADALKDPNFDVSFAADKVDVASSGDLAASRGHFTETYTDPKTKQLASVSGSYVTVYQKQPDGSWKAAEDFAAANPAS